MALTDSLSFPLVRIEPVANLQNAWVSLSIRVSQDAEQLPAALHSIFGAPDLLAAIAPLNCVLMLDSAAVIDPALEALMPPSRVAFAFGAASLQAEDARKRTLALHEKGHRVLIDGALPADTAAPAGLTGVATDVTHQGPGATVLPLVFGPHLAHGVHTHARYAECARVGYEWFSGDYPLHPKPSHNPDDGSSRKRLMTLLGCLARDADTREIETLLKQDPALSYHLLKLANSAAFAHSTPIASFGQAISILGRRQLQRWLQLLLYARQQADGLPNLLLPIAGMRAAQMEMLCKLQGGERDDQDLAFMTGVFSLLNLLFGMTMEQIVGALSLPAIASDALLTRSGKFGQLLAMIEADEVSPDMLAGAAITPLQWWNSQLHAYHWAIQVSRNL
ncbi:HDOD domain-containing protein [Massilia sp. PAMC28688]|uniref:HDOD domain-containing protein n=1 Tax=Massilia sp. PAMC28688 TaxID=2861283 RepID=UPI001C633BA3|nr:HDOD domain-containing protein [Massilia sp. PAMC28688]QYF93863.1 HDOD domain-containing protein [Massilia sp. PAMC28688]